ncbi:MBL fold metallo-hydrolase [Amycolatopsis sp. 195334CR]|nr:MBL fold metallo-hydrolase [Amycolatopsis sp. 195334CR]
MQRLILGDVEVVRLIEWHEPFLPAADFLPDVPPEAWARLAPDHWQPDTGRPVIALQTWVLHSGGRTIVIDTGAGSDRERPGMAPYFHHRRSNFLELLAHAGVRPRDVDVVVNTHLHVDHVGWNTLDAGGEWVPTFPNAEYLIPAADDAHYSGNAVQPVDRLIYEDSVAPIHRAGKALLWQDFHRIDDNLVLESAPGHTPGSSVVRLTSGTDRAVFAGDLLHSPVQILEPCCNSSSCQDQEQAAATRRRILARAADERELLIPAHFGGPGALEVRRDGSRFALGPWADFTPSPAPATPAGPASPRPANPRRRGTPRG